MRQRIGRYPMHGVKLRKYALGRSACSPFMGEEGSIQVYEMMEMVE